MPVPRAAEFPQYRIMAAETLGKSNSKGSILWPLAGAQPNFAVTLAVSAKIGARYVRRREIPRVSKGIIN